MVNLNSVIKGMKESGLDSYKIIDDLKNKGYSSREIYEAMDVNNQQPASSLEPPSPGEDEMRPSTMSSAPIEEQTWNANYPSSNFSEDAPRQQIPGRGNIEQIEEIAESIVDEKLQEFSSTIGDITMWKERVNSEISAIKQEIIRLRNHIENLQITMVGKVETYNKSISAMSTEMKALSSVMEKIIQPLSTNVKELSRITEKLKK